MPTKDLAEAPMELDPRELLACLRRAKKGDFSTRLPMNLTGLGGDIAMAFNELVERNEGLTRELARVSEAVGKEGRISQRLDMKGAEGEWSACVDSVNELITDLVQPTREIARVIEAVAKGDLSQSIHLEIEGRPLKGEFLRTARTGNSMVKQLGNFADEVTRVAREVGTEGKLGGQASVKNVAGIWKDLTDNVNLMADNLTNQVRNIAHVTTAVAKGDLSKKVTVEVRGEFLELKNTVNTMVDQLSSFADEVTRVAREVGTEGELGGQARVKGVAGIWKDLTDNVNLMADNLTGQVRNIAEVTTAVAKGDLSKTITVDVRGEMLELKNTINVMVEQLGSFADEVTRVAREVGTEGKLGGQARVKGVAGVWKDLTDNVNLMADNLTGQVRNIAEVTTAVAKGDLSKKITVEARGEILELKNTMNTMVDQLRSFANEVTRVAREVGTEGKLGGQARVEGVAGTWKDLTDNVNFMANNLTNQVRNIADVTTAVANGDLSRKITVEVQGEILELKNTINTMVDQLGSFADEVTRVAREVGTEGKLGGQADVKGVAGTWKDLTDNVNFMAANLTNQVRNIAHVTTAVANGDLSRKITVEVQGEILELKNTINTMVDQLGSFADEVTRVAREVGTEGKLGGQAEVEGVAGTWKNLTDSVNFMANNLTNQVRNIADVTTAVANGDLSRKITVEVQGEILELKNTINTMVDQLNSFASEVTRVAREVGTEGKLGGQAQVLGVAGVWKDLTDNVNGLAANLTNQVRAIADVTTAVTKGDLTRSIKVQARGEVAALKDYINEMIRNLRETTQANTEQDWLKSNLARFTRVLQGHKSMVNVSKMILSELCPQVRAHHGAFFLSSFGSDNQLENLSMVSSYAYRERKNLSTTFEPGEGLVGQCAIEAQRILLTNVPNDYVQINSGLGEAPPLNIVVLPILFEGQVRAVVELASFERFNDISLAFLEQLAEIIGITINNIEAMMRTEELLKESQALAKELQSQPQLRIANERLEQQAAALQASEEELKQQREELRRTNEELANKASLLSHQKEEVERTNRKLEQARQALEEKAEQLTLTSKYKSEFLANMSHELRTPLNSLLILAKLLTENKEKNMTGRQVEAAQTIHGAGIDLLNLINDILDLSKIESGTIVVESASVDFRAIEADVERNFRQLAESRGIDFSIELSSELPEEIDTDFKRLQQILKNLLSNAFKFTPEGSVKLTISLDASGWNEEHPILSTAGSVVAFAVSDTGIGIPADKQSVVFEAFQQVDGTTHRKYGGTGLGLSISRELSHLLGGEITLQSQEDEGSVFTLFLPLSFVEPPQGYRHSEKLQEVTHLEHQDLPLPPVPKEAVADDKDSLGPDDLTVMIVEDDPHFAKLMVESARQEGFKALVAQTMPIALQIAQKYQLHAVTLDLQLPGGSGWTLLDFLKHNATTRHLPVGIISVDDNQRRGYSMGAYFYLEKPVEPEKLSEAFSELYDFAHRPQRRMLVIEDNKTERDSIVALITGDDDVEAVAVSSAEEALVLLQEQSFLCIVLDLRLPGMGGREFLQKAREQTQKLAPVIIFTGAALSSQEISELEEVSSTVIIKGADSPERLLEATSLYLHRESFSESERELLQRAQKSNPDLKGRRVLAVDDDERNLLALKSLLEDQGMIVFTCKNGKEALGTLNRDPEFDLVLMDIMMPEMDGYTTTRAIRRLPGMKGLPIIAVTAKAMPGDREKCIDAGATEYIPKPVDSDKLLSVLRVLTFRETRSQKPMH